ncbi:hypothetical protein TanjilG_27443 [Lupinus angustifolius]|uniref:Secreted protein n=1 Tax=Lupinus angustifolius TaxID=3871 RepID=A0A1J7GHA2_LUPAN|nr:hypothetical protein TanjilG_27443 [Lupinus angustifolius]
MLRFLMPWMLLILCVAFFTARAAQRGPFAMRISCGARQNVQTVPTTTLWFKDFGCLLLMHLDQALLPLLSKLFVFPLVWRPSKLL